MPKGKDLEWRLQRTEQQLRLFQKISRFMVREMSLQEVLQGVVSLVVEFTQADSCLIYLLDNDELVLCASNTPHPSTIGKIRLRLNEGLTGWVARERRLLSISREAYSDPRFRAFGDILHLDLQRARARARGNGGGRQGEDRTLARRPRRQDGCGRSASFPRIATKRFSRPPSLRATAWSA